MQYDHRDWLVAENVIGDETWLIHRSYPWFIGQVFDEGDELPIVGGLSLSLSNGQTLAKILWFDEPIIDEQELVSLCEDAGKALDQYDAMLDADNRRAEVDDDEPDEQP